MTPALRVFPGWLTEQECAELRRRWRRSHAETGHIPDGAPAGAKVRIDHAYKRRADQFIGIGTRLDQKLCRNLRRVAEFPQYAEFEQFRIGCYGKGGHFAPHRDDSTEDLADRKVAVVCGLSDASREYRGGILRFPELSVSLRIRAGMLVLFSADLLHGVTPVTSGRRFALIGFAKWA